MTILITGGSGFIGREVISQCLSQTNEQIINIDCLSYAGNFYPEIVSTLDEQIKSRYIFEKANLCDAEIIESLIFQYKPSAIIHLAAESHVDQSIKSAGSFIQSNIVGTFNLLEGVRKYLECYPKLTKTFRFLHVSTDEVFGDLSFNENPFTEQSQIKPSSPYSASKASSDLLVDAWIKTHNLPCLISHCSNNYGHFQYPEKLIPLMIKNAISYKPLGIYGDGNNIRDWLHVKDHASALLQILFKGVVGEHYNIGANNEKSNNDIVDLICDELSRIDKDNGQPDYDYKSLIHYVDDRKGHDLRYAIDSTKIKKELNWKAKIVFEDGLRETVNWYYRYFTTNELHRGASNE